MKLLTRRPSAFRTQSDTGRTTDRIHLTDILHYIVESVDLFNQKGKRQDFGGRIIQIKMALGLAWEEWWSKQLEAEYGAVFHPGEQECDGIIGTPDGICAVKLDDGREVVVVEEIKLSYFSQAREFTDGCWELRLWQVLGYCKMMGLNHGRFWVMHLNGGYRPPAEPEFEELVFEFTNEEIDANWRMVTNNLATMKRKGIVDELLAGNKEARVDWIE